MAVVQEEVPFNGRKVQVVDISLSNLDTLEMEMNME